MSADGSFIGFAKQVSKGTPITDPATFKYMLFNQGTVAPSNVVIPLDPEVGGGALLRSMVKVGVSSGGALEFIPRPATLGSILLGALGKVDSAVDGVTAGYTHTFTLDPANQLTAPYWTVRSAPGGLWGEQFQDVRFTALSLSFKGANFVRGQVGMVGGLPTKIVFPGAAATAWDAINKVDSGPQFITPVSAIELPTGSPAKVLSGSFTAGMSIPLDEQWIVGAYSPDDFDVARRAFAISLNIKITDATLYSKIMYDPSGGNAWVAKLMKEAAFKFELVSDTEATTGKPYKLTIAGNGNSGDTANVIWSASPIGLRAGKQVVMNVTGIFLADPAGTNPITVTLYNKETAY